MEMHRKCIKYKGMPIPGVSLCQRRSRGHRCISPGLTQPVMQCRLPIAVLGEIPEAAAAPTGVGGGVRSATINTKRTMHEMHEILCLCGQLTCRQLMGFSPLLPHLSLLSLSRTGHGRWGDLDRGIDADHGLIPQEWPNPPFGPTPSIFGRSSIIQKDRDSEREHHLKEVPGVPVGVPSRVDLKPRVRDRASGTRCQARRKGKVICSHPCKICR